MNTSIVREQGPLPQEPSKEQSFENNPPKSRNSNRLKMFIFLPSSLLGGRSCSNLREMEVFGDQNPRVFGLRARGIKRGKENIRNDLKIPFLSCCTRYFRSSVPIPARADLLSAQIPKLQTGVTLPSGLCFRSFLCPNWSPGNKLSNGSNLTSKFKVWKKKRTKEWRLVADKSF